MPADRGPVATALELGDRGAELSPCGRYRYRLWRTWSSEPPVLFVMLNPSTADAAADDPTIRRCVGFARRWGAGGIEVVNLYPWRATDPSNLPNGPEVFGALPEGHEHNARAIRAAAAGVARIIAAWGANSGPWRSQPAVVMDVLGDRLVEALALTKDGAPRHPLYVQGDVEPIPFRGGDA